MRTIGDEQRVWITRKLKERGRGAKAALAKHLGVRPDAVSRMIGSRESREIYLDELHRMAAFFDESPPGLLSAEKQSSRAKKDARFSWIPLIDYVTAGTLRSPLSQLDPAKWPLFAFADLGPGEWFALRVDMKGDGDSMDRYSPPGSTIAVNAADRDLINGRCYIFSIKGDTTYKMWQEDDPPYLSPYSTNPRHKPILVRRKRDFEVIGRVKRTVLDL